MLSVATPIPPSSNFGLGGLSRSARGGEGNSIYIYVCVCVCVCVCATVHSRERERKKKLTNDQVTGVSLLAKQQEPQQRCREIASVSVWLKYIYYIIIIAECKPEHMCIG